MKNEVIESPAFMTETADMTENAGTAETIGITEAEGIKENLEVTTEATTEGAENETHTNTNDETDYVDFESDEFSKYKDIFKGSKISKEDLNNFIEKINESASAEVFSDDMEKTYGNNAEDALSTYREMTDDIFTDEEKDFLNQCPSDFKMLLVKLGNAFNDKYTRLQKEYGLTTQEITAKPENNSLNAKEKFRELTNKIINNDYKSMDEYNSLIKERLKIAEFI